MKSIQNTVYASLLTRNLLKILNTNELQTDSVFITRERTTVVPNTQNYYHTLARSCEFLRTTIKFNLEGQNLTHRHPKTP